MLLSTIATVVVPVTGAVVVVVDVDDDVDVLEDEVVGEDVDFVSPKRRNLAIIALSSFQTGNRMSWSDVVTAPRVGITSVDRFADDMPRKFSARLSRSPRKVESISMSFTASAMKALIDSGL